MKRRILLVFLVIVIVSQIPFACRRYRLSRLNKTIQQLASQRIPQQTENGYVDYRGPQSEFDTSAMPLSGTHAGVLFINGNEVATSNGDRLLLIPGSSSAASMNTQSTQEIIEKQKAARGLALAAYPTESQNWQSTSIDGVEIYNLFTNARRYNALVGFFDGLWSYGSYPDLMFANFFARPTENLSRWDQAITERHRKLVATAGNDAHSNIGLNLNDASGKQWLGIKLDPYERSFRTVRTHVLIPKDKELSRESLLEAISQGHCYVSFDLFGDPKGFSFAVATSQTPRQPVSTHQRRERD